MGEEEKCSVSLVLLNNNIAIYSWKQLKQPVPQFCTELPHAADIRLDLRPLVITIYELVPGPARACASSSVNVCNPQYFSDIIIKYSHQTNRIMHISLLKYYIVIIGSEGPCGRKDDEFFL